jgi:ABC-type transport system involved in multi-copper enzyme maturation permease subunit
MRIFPVILFTIRELGSKITLYILAGISSLIILILALGLSLHETEVGAVGALFSLPFTPPMQPADLGGVIRGMQAGLASGLFAGITLLGVIATASVIPDMLEKGIAELQLSKPLERWQLLLGKYFGGVLALLANAVYFLAGIWFVFGIKIGLWNVQVLLSAFTLTFMFACLYALVVLLGVLFRSTAISILGAFLYLFVLGGLLQGREVGLYLVSESPVYRGLLDGIYYLLPQFAGMQQSLGRQIMDASLAWKPFVQSFFSSCMLLGISAALFHRQDY